MILFSDIHVHDNDFLNQSLELLEQLVLMSNELGEHLVFCGDLVHKDNYVPKIVIHNIHCILKELNLPMIAISGNHDHLGYNYFDKRAVSYLSSLNNIVLLDDFNYFDIGDIRLHGIPYYHAPECFYRHLEAISKNKRGRDILLVHQTPKGIALNLPHQIDPESIVGYERVFSGHIHEYQRITKNFTMLGNCGFVDSTDYGVRKFIFRYTDLKLKKIESFFCENPQQERIKKVNMHIEPVVVQKEGKVDMESTLSKYCDQEKLNDSYKEVGLNLLR